ncbi:Ku protein [Haliangium sp.]|uniref:non-homologous end joining protein Ku n=1 Tax=Haliangium sp. TaxID=2663208 RepID=UPI003D140721
MVARAFGSATVSFGLVSIPVKIYTTTKPGSHIGFHMLHDACGTRLKQQYICPEHDEVVSRDRTAKGFEYDKGKYLKLSPDEVKALEAVSDNAISLSEFVPAHAVDPVYYDKAYYLGPDQGGERAYQLLGHAMRETGLVGLARYSARGKQYVVLVRPHGEDGLIMHQLRYQDEIRSFAEVPLGEDVAIDDAELNLAVQIIEQVSSERFEPGKYRDEVKERVLELIESKLGGEEITPAPAPPRGEIIDLMEALKASLGASAEAGAAEAARKPAKTAPREPEAVPGETHSAESK